MSSTKDRILDAAELLFARQGVAGTSLRSITQAADVNSAAIHYHFGSKAQLVEALIQRRIAPVNERRLKQLEQLEAAAAGGPVAVEALIEAFLSPIVAARDEFRLREPQLAGLFAWLRFERDSDFRRIHEAFEEVRHRYAAAVARACGDDDIELADERLGFAIGATLHLLHGARGEESPEPEPVTPQRFTRLLQFLAAGFAAPVDASALHAASQHAPARVGAGEGVRA